MTDNFPNKETSFFFMQQDAIRLDRTDKHPQIEKQKNKKNIFFYLFFFKTKCIDQTLFTEVDFFQLTCKFLNRKGGSKKT